MPARANPEAEQALLDYGQALADAVEAALPGWVVRSVERLMFAWQGDDRVDPRVLSAAAEAGARAATDVGRELRALLAVDIDEQRINPLTLLRRAVRYPAAVLADAGVPPIVRDEQSERMFPDDIYGLSPASFADIDASLHEPGLAWGAAKAHVHLARRRGGA
jgi:hypothetical protein